MYMQRLYSLFPNSWPGFGLLILRLVILTFAIMEVDHATWTAGSLTVALRIGELLVGGLIFVGLLTPLVALSFVVLECYEMTSGAWDEHGVRALIALSVALLGPGSWSFDARIYGRKVIVVPDRSN
jgi:putative oxidoreductase